MSLESTLSAGAEALGIPLSEASLGAFRRYYDLLALRSGQFNLTAIRGEEEAARLHFLDSLGLLAAWDFKEKRVIDIGTGAGFPGWPLKIAEPSLDLTLVDSTEKKVGFLREVSETLALPARCLHARAEELAADWEERETYEVAVSRAVARLNILAELCLPFVKPGGVFIAMKAADSDGEIAEAEKAVRALGGSVPEVFSYPVPGTEITRRAVIIRKAAQTPEKYPRSFGKIKKAPL